MITKVELSEGTKLKIKNEQAGLGADSELEVLFAGDKNILVKTQNGDELTTDYTALSAMYEIVPVIEPTQENMVPRFLEQTELMIAHLSCFTQSQTGEVDPNILAIGTKLHAMRDELASYTKNEESTQATETSRTEQMLKTHHSAA